MRTVLHLLLLACLLTFLSGCRKDSVKRELPPLEKPLPVRVDCNQPSATDPPMHPLTTDPVAWTVWATQIYLTVEQERELDRIEETCIQKLKDQGVIR